MLGRLRPHCGPLDLHVIVCCSMKRSRGEGEAVGTGKSVRKEEKRKRTHWNFKTDYNDHFETPLRAYQDLLPVLRTLSRHLFKPECIHQEEETAGLEDSLHKLNVFDPYFCLGSMKEMLQSLGISKVINRNRDFYKDITNNNLPGSIL